MVIGPCPKDNPLDKEVKYSFSLSEEPGSGLAVEFHIDRKKPAQEEIKDRDRITCQVNSSPLFKKGLEKGKKSSLIKLHEK